MTPPSPVLDRHARPLGSLRLSVTDRCNMRCGYCMPEDDYVWLPRASLLTYEEMARLAGIFGGLGARKVRITGGEPLLRQDLHVLVRRLAALPTVDDLALTTNGLLLEAQAPVLALEGLRRVTVSLDTLRADRLQAFARTARHGDILAGIDAAARAGLGVKLNTVVMRGFNDDEVLDLLEFARARGAELRFIEYMDVGGATRWSAVDVVSRAELLARIAARHGAVEPLPGDDRLAAPAERFRLADGTTFGIIASVTAPFCGTCDRSRLTADGHWYLCLYAPQGIDLRGPLRAGASDDELAALVRGTWEGRRDRGAEDRLAAADRGALYQLTALRADPRREMHTRGG